MSVSLTSVAENDNETAVDWTRRATGLESILGFDKISAHLCSNIKQKQNVDIWLTQSVHVKTLHIHAKWLCEAQHFRMWVIWA